MIERRRLVGQLLAAFLIPLLVVSIIAHRAQAGSPEAEAGAFIKSLADDAISMLSDTRIGDQERKEKFRALIKRGLDLERVSRFVLGAYARKASESEFSEFKNLLEENIVETYAIRFKDYNGELFSVGRVSPDKGDSYLVDSRIDPADGSGAIDVGWRVHKTDEGWKIMDILVQGLSMVITQRDEYISFIRQNGGKVSALNEALKAKNAKLQTAKN